jgi:outer membrane protein assembly factor BamB
VASQGLLSLLLIFCSVPLARGGDWPQFRGPNGSGVSGDKGLPAEFGPNKNVIWKTELPPGHSSPILVGPRIFLTASQGEVLYTISLDRETGKVLWKRQAPRPRQEGMQQTNSPASPSPVSDGHNVYVFFGDYGIICYGVDGDERWKAPLGPFNNVNGHGSSPILADGLLILICDQDTDSYLIALDKNTGKVAWRVERPEVTRGYATPGVYRPKSGPAELIVPGAYELIAYNLATGEKLWWVRGLAWQLKSVPLIDGDIIYVNGWEIGGDTDVPPEVPTFAEILAQYDANKDGVITPDEAPAKLKNWYREQDFNRNGKMEEREWNFYRAMKTAQNSILAVRAGGRGDVTETRVLWRFRKSIPNVPSPLLYRDVIYLVKDGGIATTLNPKTGEMYKQARLAGALDHYWASPVAGDGKVYMISQACKVTVLKAAGDWETLAVNDLDDDCFSTPAIADSRLYIRTRSALYCFGRKKE